MDCFHVSTVENNFQGIYTYGCQHFIKTQFAVDTIFVVGAYLCLAFSSVNLLCSVLFFVVVLGTFIKANKAHSAPQI